MSCPDPRAVHRRSSVRLPSHVPCAALPHLPPGDDRGPLGRNVSAGRHGRSRPYDRPAGVRREFVRRVAIVTDSTADLEPGTAEAAGIRVVPLFVRFGTEEFRVGVDLTTEQFWTRMLAPDA